LAITFLDLWWVPLIALGLQIFTSIYLFKIYKRIGNKLTEIFTGFQILGFVYVGIILERFITNPPMIEDQSFDPVRLFFGFVFPVANSILHFRLKRFYVKGLEPNTAKQNAERDAKRDAARDIERDIDRDKERDYRRDLYKDNGNNGNNGNHDGNNNGNTDTSHASG
jgi:hypothetical protein